MRALLLVAIFFITQAHATPQRIWLLWEFDPADQAPPASFLLTITSPTGNPVPAPVLVPYTNACPPAPDLTDKSHCSLVGCPPDGVWQATVMAHFPDGDGTPSNVAECTITAHVCACQEDHPPTPSVPPPLPLPPPPPLPPIRMDATPPKLASGLPPLTQQGPEGLGLKPVGNYPVVQGIPPLPASGGT